MNPQILNVLTTAKQMYEQDNVSIINVFPLACQSLGVSDEVRLEAIRAYILALPDLERVMNIQEVLVGDLLSTFDRAIQQFATP